jgi:hypothetical protein
VSPSTAPWLEAPTTLIPAGIEDSTSRSVNGTLPGFVTVYVKVTGSPTTAAPGLTELAMEISGAAQGLPSAGGVSCAVNADITKSKTLSATGGNCTGGGGTCPGAERCVD